MIILQKIRVLEQGTDPSQLDACAGHSQTSENLKIRYKSHLESNPTMNKIPQLTHVQRQLQFFKWMKTSSYALGQTLSFGFCLTGRSPPRKSDVSMCKWQLTEYNFWFAKAANTWQIVVFPHLSEIRNRLTSRMNSKYSPTNTPVSKRESASLRQQTLLVNRGPLHTWLRI